MTILTFRLVLITQVRTQALKATNLYGWKVKEKRKKFINYLLFIILSLYSLFDSDEAKCSNLSTEQPSVEDAKCSLAVCFLLIYLIIIYRFLMMKMTFIGERISKLWLAKQTRIFSWSFKIIRSIFNCNSYEQSTDVCCRSLWRDIEFCARIYSRYNER